MEQVEDYISGYKVAARPEEVNSVQPFAQKLVKDYGYPKEHIKTRPQFQIKTRPSGNATFPVDIAIFNSSDKVAHNLYVIVECKDEKIRITDKEKSQLRDYLFLSDAELGVLHQPQETIFYRKRTYSGKLELEEIPDLPRYGEKVDEIGKFRYKDLQPPRELVMDFERIRNRIAGSAKGDLSHEGMARDIINILFCKIVDERNHEHDDVLLDFRCSASDSDEDVEKRIKKLLTEVRQRGNFDDVFNKNDNISLDRRTLRAIVEILQKYKLLNSTRDVIGNAFEVFIGPALAGDEGQFFTPRVVAETMIDMIDIDTRHKIIDPACGSGGFLTVCLDRISKTIRSQNSNQYTQLKKQIEFARSHLYGIDKNRFLFRVAKAYMALLGDGRTNIFCEDSLENPNNWDGNVQASVKLGDFDVVVTNPPFGTKVAVDEHIPNYYELARKWTRSRGGGYEKSSQLKSKCPPQVMFIERCLDLVNVGGRVGIVLPEGIFGNNTHFHIVFWLMQRAYIDAVVSLPSATFKLTGKQGTSTRTQFVVLTKKQNNSPPQSKSIFMAIAEKIGHDSRGNDIPDNNLVEILTSWKEFRSSGTIQNPTQFGYLVELRQIDLNRSLVCRRFDPRTASRISEAENENCELVPLGELVESKLIQVIGQKTDVRKDDYLPRDGDKGMPFIRTSDIANLEIVSTTAERVEENVCDYKENDILFVKDGDKLIGETAIVTESDLPFALQSHFYVLRSLDTQKMHPYLLLALLNSTLSKRMIRSLIVIQSTLGTIGNRYKGILLPIPRDQDKRQQIIHSTEQIITQRKALINKFRHLVSSN